MTRYPYPYPFQPDEEPGSPLVTWAAVVLLLLLVAIVIFIVPADVGAPSGFLPSSAGQSPNPELGAYWRFQQSNPVSAEFVFAPDPLLGAFRIHQSRQARMKTAAYLAQNPEVGIYHRYLDRRH